MQSKKLKGVILSNGFIKADNGEIYELSLTHINNLYDIQNNSLINRQVIFDIHNGIACNIDIEITLQNNQHTTTESISTNTSQIHAESTPKGYIIPLENITLFKRRVKIMLVCNFILPIFVIPLFIAAYMQFLLTKQIAIQAQNKTLMFYFFMSSGSMYFITLLALFSGIFGIEMSGELFFGFIGLSSISIFIGMILYLRLLGKITGEKLFMSAFYIVLCAGLVGRFVLPLGIICLILAPIFYSIAWLRIKTIRVG